MASFLQDKSSFFLAVILLLITQTSCGVTTSYHGYIISSEALRQIQVGSSKEKIDIVMGVPSIKASVGDPAYYYISETRERNLWDQLKIVDRSVLAIYFDKHDRVKRIANYALHDGIVVNFTDRTTEKDNTDNFLQQLLSSSSMVYNPLLQE